MENNDTRFDILKAELSLAQGQVDKYDGFSTTIKAWAVTLWTASTGWAFQIHRSDIFLVSIVLLVIFWFFDSMNKTFRRDYRMRREAVAKVLASLFETGRIPAGTISPNLPAPDHDMFRGAVRSFFFIHVALPYVILIAISIFLYTRGGI